MKLLNLKPVAHTIHNMNNDYEIRIPMPLRVLGVLGGITALVALVSMLTTATSLNSVLVLLLGGGLTLPAVVTHFVTNAALRRRFRVRDDIVFHAALRGHEQVLDVGTGSGIMLFGCAKHLTTGRCVGIDTYLPHAGGGTPQIFWKNAAKEGVKERVELKTMDARAMTFPNESFDVIVSTFAFHHIGGDDSRRKAASEIARVLKRGGKVFVYDAGFALDELVDVLRAAGVETQKHGEQFAMVIGEKKA